MTTIPMIPASDYRREHYGILYESVHVYQTNESHSPTRVVVWDNTHRVNPDPGGPVKYGEMGPLPTGGDGKYIDPNNKATDAERTILLSTESTVITAQRNGTGHPDSGQVWALGVTIRDGDDFILDYPDAATDLVIAKFPRYSNGHGYCEVLG